MDKRDFRKLVNTAHEAGMKAGNGSDVQMLTLKNTNGKVYEPFPICGFAWISLRPATSAFARWLKKQGIGRTAYEGGHQIWCSEFGQSYDRKLAYADAYAGVLKEAGFNAYGAGRLD